MTNKCCPLLGLILLFTSHVYADNKVSEIKLALYNGVPDQIDFTNGKLSGSYASALKCIIQHSELKMHFSVFPLVRQVHSLKQGIVDAAYPLSITESRNNQFIATNPIKEEEIIIISLKENPVTKDNLLKHSGAVVRGTVFDDYLKKINHPDYSYNWSTLVSSQVVLKERVEFALTAKDVWESTIKLQLSKEELSRLHLSSLFKAPVVIYFNKNSKHVKTAIPIINNIIPLCKNK